MPPGGYWKGVWKCVRCGKKLDRQVKICDDCVREIYEIEVQQSSISHVAKKYGLTRQTLYNRRKQVFNI
ncbi:MAG: hypothetical protein H0Z19_05300 [Archaeoglobus sp.]|uniref:hypothetical protein n=1 Tax=Archaeoglobus sp. TaxID=1872626 RepID=UPI001D47C443|nr:hypothetical protein [Archaeoglobus sp.]MBO8179884.1 hypothetical protein [Archaeoglobus sp.]